MPIGSFRWHGVTNERLLLYFNSASGIRLLSHRCTPFYLHRADPCASALPSKADIHCEDRNVPFGPTADSCTAANGVLGCTVIRSSSTAPQMVRLAQRMGTCCPVGSWRRTASALSAQPCRRRETALLRVRCRPSSGRCGSRSRMSRASLPPRGGHQGTAPGPQFDRSPGGRLRSRWPLRWRRPGRQ